MADKTVKQDGEPMIQVDVAEAFSILGRTMVDIAREQEELRKVLGKILEERAGFQEALGALEAKVGLLMKLEDHHQAILECAGLASPRPKGSNNVN